MRRAVTALAVVSAMVWALAAPAGAPADGDPASDYLYTQSVFLPAGTPAAIQNQMRAVVRASDAAGAPVKVAVIGSAYDLGSITPLWEKPQTYARFLGVELSYRYHGPLVIVMPNGYGVNDRSSRIGQDRHALTGLRVGAGPAGLAAAAEAAVRRLAAARGHPIPAAVSAGARPTPGVAGTTARWLKLAAIAAGLLAIAAAWTLSLRRRPAHLPVSIQRVRVRLSVHAVAFLLAGVALAASTAIVVAAVATRRPAPAPATSPASAGGLSWHAGSRPAPGFRLRDQTGGPVSMRSLRGRVVILAFLDPVCRHLCPLEATLLGQVERRFGAAERPQVVAVSVNPWGDDRANLVRDVRRWNVGPGWQWAVGRPAALARVWNAYKVGVKDRRLHVGGQTVHEISHDELIYVIDPHGFERWLYPYPFSVAQVVSAIHQVQGARA